MTEKPTTQEWKKLYKTAQEFQKLAPWKWMWDNDIFGVQHPETGEIEYCCVMGANGEFLGISLNHGAEGLEILQKVASGGFQDGTDMLAVQDCLITAFETKDYIEDEDLEIIDKISFKGSYPWPKFRNYAPGYYPALPNKEEVRFMIIALEQAMDVCKRFKKDKKLLKARREGFHLVRVPKKQGAKLIWQDKYLNAKPKKQKSIPTIDEQNEIRAFKIKEDVERREEMRWEIDYFFMPSPMKDEKNKNARPFFPYIFLIVEGYAGVVLGVQVIKPFEDYIKEFRAKFLNAILEHNFFPEKIYASKKEVIDILKPITEILEIDILLSPKLNMLNEAKQSLSNHFKEQK